jgi:hypothetical protein
MPPVYRSASGRPDLLGHRVFTGRVRVGGGYPCWIGWRGRGILLIPARRRRRETGARNVDRLGDETIAEGWRARDRFVDRTDHCRMFVRVVAVDEKEDT